MLISSAMTRPQEHLFSLSPFSVQVGSKTVIKSPNSCMCGIGLSSSSSLLESVVGSLESVVGSLESVVGSLESVVGSLESVVMPVSVVSVLESVEGSELGTLESDVLSLESVLEALESVVGTLESVFVMLESVVFVLESVLVALESVALPESELSTSSETLVSELESVEPLMPESATSLLIEGFLVFFVLSPPLSVVLSPQDTAKKQRQKISTMDKNILLIIPSIRFKVMQ